MPASLVCTTHAYVVDIDDNLHCELADIPAAPPELLDVIAQIPDLRKARGIRHRLPVIVLLAAAAVLTGATSFTAIAQWARHCGRALLDAAGMPEAEIPSEPTIRRILEMIDPHRFDLLIYAWMRLRFTTISGRKIIACDGKKCVAPKTPMATSPIYSRRWIMPAGP